MQCSLGRPRLSQPWQQPQRRMAVAPAGLHSQTALERPKTCRRSSHRPALSSSSSSRQRAVTCRAADDRQAPGSSKSIGGLAKFNPVYLAIFGAFAALLAFRNPYIYAVLTVVTILPQNSNVTSLNNLVLLFYESGLFMNFAEAVTCVRLVTWLSMGFMVASFAIFK